jgi:hypothetical protein
VGSSALGSFDGFEPLAAQSFSAPARFYTLAHLRLVDWMGPPPCRPVGAQFSSKAGVVDGPGDRRAVGDCHIAQKFEHVAALSLHLVDTGPNPAGGNPDLRREPLRRRGCLMATGTNFEPDLFSTLRANEITADRFFGQLLRRTRATGAV